MIGGAEVVVVVEKAGLKPESFDAGGRGGSEGCDGFLESPGGPRCDMMNFLRHKKMTFLKRKETFVAVRKRTCEPFSDGGGYCSCNLFRRSWLTERQRVVSGCAECYVDSVMGDNKLGIGGSLEVPSQILFPPVLSPPSCGGAMYGQPQQGK